MHSFRGPWIAAALGTSSIMLAACGGSAEPADSSGASEPVTLSFGHVLAEAQPWHQCGALPMKEAVESAEVGITVEIFPASTTQNDTLEQLDALETGNLDITLAGGSQLATRLDKASIFDAAYLFNDAEHMQRVVNGPIGDEVWEELRQEAGFRVLTMGYYGARHVTANVPVRSPADLSGIKMRVVDAPLFLDNGIALGAEPVSIAFGELYLALQQGVVDAEENPLPVIAAQGFDEVQDYVSMTGHVYASLALVIADSSWDELSAEQQEVLAGAAEAFGEDVTECTLEEETTLLEEWKQPGSPIEVVEDVDLDAFREAAADYLPEKYADVWGDLFQRVRDEA